MLKIHYIVVDVLSLVKAVTVTQRRKVEEGKSVGEFLTAITAPRVKPKFTCLDMFTDNKKVKVLIMSNRMYLCFLSTSKM